MSVIVGPWPWSLLNLLYAAVWVVAVVRAWHSADHVVRANWPWTRAWRTLLATVVTVGVHGSWIPLGAIYIAIKYRPVGLRHAGAPSSATRC